MSTLTPLSVRQLTLLTFLRGAGTVDLDPVRIMKGLFLVSQEVPAHWLASEERYDFEPYNYGPYAPAIYADLKLLTERELIVPTNVVGTSWSYYSLSPAGERLVEEDRARLDSGLVGYLGEIQRFVTGLSFRDLLNAVYDRYPDFAVKSVFRRPTSV